MDLLNLISRETPLFAIDVEAQNQYLNEIVTKARFLVIGGAGTIGQAVCKEIFSRDPAALHVVDISENNMVELVRELRSTIGYGSGEFKTFSIDCGSMEFDVLLEAEGPYDFVFNLSALKHVRSESDPFTLLRMINVNIINTVKSVRILKKIGTKKYFCVSTDKAANPVNMMGASKRIMELFLMRESLVQDLSMARFANVAFSDGSLLHGFDQRFLKQQPISAPIDVKRYFVTPKESGELCLLSGLLGENRDIFFPKMSEELNLVTFSSIAERYLHNRGYEAYLCSTEEEARSKAQELILEKKWPCYFFESDTTGEKDFEEFFTDEEKLDMQRFETIGVIKNEPLFDEQRLDEFLLGIESIKEKKIWNKLDLLELYYRIIPEFKHSETGKYLDQRM